MTGHKGSLNSAAFLKLLFQSVVDITAVSLFDVSKNNPVHDLYVTLHTADPTESGNQSSHESKYMSYARVAVSRTANGWAVNGTTVSNVSAIIFPACTGGNETATYFGIGTAPHGPGLLLYAGPLTSTLPITANVTPNFGSSSLSITEG
jgi:hypothetical protein